MTDKEQKVYDYILGKDGATLRSIVADVDISRITGLKIIKSLLSSGCITMRKDKRKWLYFALKADDPRQIKLF